CAILFSLLSRPSKLPRFPYTTLFRSLRSERQAEEVVEAVRSAGGEAIAIRADVSVRDEVHAMVRETVERWGRIDILMNNAGVARSEEHTSELQSREKLVCRLLLAKK